MKNKTISLMRGLAFAMLAFVSTASFAQITATGTVVDAATGEEIIGASVLEVGTTNGTITDFEGNFSLKVQSGAKLSISYMGYKTQEIAAGQNVRVQLSEDSELLDEVVVVGYGVVKKNDATGSVTAIKPDEMNKGLVTSAQDMMQGKIAGVQVTSDGGTPGGGATIRIRGGSSLSASNNPLIVIDGLAMDNNGIQGVANPLSLVNPSDIESFTVLKDASATAIYGSRASNGVIIITTKKGASGQKPKFSYEGNVSAGTVVSRIEPLSGNAYRNYLTARGNVDMTDIGTANTNWQDEIYRVAISTDHNFSVTGGLKNMPYRASIGYTLQNGVIKTSQMQRVTASINLSPTFLDKHLTFNLNAKGMYSYNRYTDGGSVVGAALSMDPTQSPYDNTYAAFGGYYQTSNLGGLEALNDSKWDNTTNTVAGISNPLAMLYNKKNTANSGSFVGNLEADYKIHGFEDMHLHANFGADYSYGKQPMTENIYSFSNNYYGWQQLEEKNKYNLQFNAYAQYYKDFTETQHFDIMAGYEWQHFYSDYTYNGYGLYPETNNDASLRGQKHNESSNESITENYLVSFFGRANYIGWNQLMLTATFRADGSSRFQKGHRWGYFPSVALGWKIKETFDALRDNNTISEFKLRLGYGITGQQDLGDDYIGLRRYTYSQDYAYYTDGAKDKDGNYIYDKTIRPQGFNDELTWEKTTTYNAGIDLGFLNSRITTAIDYYYRMTNDLIAYVNVPAGTNFADQIYKNIGSLSNQGVELMINAVAIDHSRAKSKFKWDLGFNYTYNINKIEHLTTGEGSDYYVATGYISNGVNIQRQQEGYASNTFFVYRTNKDSEGHVHIIDQTGDGVINNADLVPYHHSAPDMTFGLQSKWQFYNFDLGISLRASVGNYVYNQVLAGSMFSVQTPYRDHSYTNLRADQINTYNRTIGYAGSEISTENARLMDIFVENASFLRCDNITLGYSFAKDKVLTGRAYLTVQNPFVISGYSGLDPEIFDGIDGNIYPRCMTTLVGLSLQF